VLDTLALRFNSPHQLCQLDAKGYVNKSPSDTMKSLTWLAHSHQAYRSMIVYKIKLFLSCTREKKEWFSIIFQHNFDSLECDFCLYFSELFSTSKMSLFSAFNCKALHIFSKGLYLTIVTFQIYLNPLFQKYHGFR